MHPSLAASATGGLGVPAALALLIPMEAGIPIPLPFDLVLLFVGERAAAGAIPLWLAVVALEAVALIGTAALFLACRGPGSALVNRLGPRLGLTRERMARATAVIERRGGPALAIGRGTPGLRTATCVAAGASGLTLRRALPALVIGSSVFLQLHLFLGYFLGQAAGDLIETARCPVPAHRDTSPSGQRRLARRCCGHRRRARACPLDELGDARLDQFCRPRVLWGSMTPP